MGPGVDGWKGQALDERRVSKSVDRLLDVGLEIYVGLEDVGLEVGLRRWV